MFLPLVRVHICWFIARMAQKSPEDVRGHFEMTVNGKQGAFACRVAGCSAVIVCPKSSTTNLRRHLVSSHLMLEYNAATLCVLAQENRSENIEAKKDRTQHSLFELGIKRQCIRGSAFRKLEPKQQKVVQVLLTTYDMIAHLRPICSSKDVGRRVFNDIVGSPSASQTSCKDMMRLLFDQVMDSIKNQLQDVVAYALTTDGWSNYGNEHFCAVTLHWLAPAFAYVGSACIGVLHQTDERISAEVIARDIRSMLTNRLSFNVRDKLLVVCATDEGSNFRKCVTQCLNPPPADPKLICADHWLKTCLEHALNSSPDIKATFERCSDLSKTLKYVRTLKDLLEAKQKFLHDADPEGGKRPPRCKPVLPVITRWGSHFDCLSKLWVLKDAIREVHDLLHDRHGAQLRNIFDGKYKNFCDNYLTQDQWSAVGQLLDVLGPFRWLIKLAQGEYYPTLAVTWANLFAALELLQHDARQLEMVNAFKAAFRSECEARFCDTERVPTSALVAVGLDPRYHNTNVFHNYPRIAEMQERCLLQAINAVLIHDRQLGPAAAAEEQLPQPRHQRDDSDEEQHPGLSRAPSLISIQRKGTEALLNGVQRLPPRAPMQVNVTAEAVLAEYRGQPGLQPDVQQSEVLAWFRSRLHISSLEPAFKVASMYCFVPSTTAPSERVGSTAGQVFSKRRLRLAPAVAEYIVVCHESRRRMERSIIAMSPHELLREMEDAFARAAAQGEGNDADDEDEGLETDTSDEEL